MGAVLSSLSIVQSSKQKLKQQESLSFLESSGLYLFSATQNSLYKTNEPHNVAVQCSCEQGVPDVGAAVPSQGRATHAM